MHRENRFGGGDRRSFAPVRVGEEIDVKIEAVGEKGDGIAKIKGFVIFVPNVKQGEDVKIRITKVLRKVGFGEVVSGATESHSKRSHMDESQESSQEESDEEISSQEDTGSEQSDETTSDEDADSEDFGEEDSQQEEY